MPLWQVLLWGGGLPDKTQTMTPSEAAQIRASKQEEMREATSYAREWIGNQCLRK